MQETRMPPARLWAWNTLQGRAASYPLMLVTAAIVPIPFSSYGRAMDAVDREELIRLLTEALMRDCAFRPHRRHWAADATRRRLEAQTCAAGLVEHLYRCGIRWSCLPPAPPHKTC